LQTRIKAVDKTGAQCDRRRETMDTKCIRL